MPDQPDPKQSNPQPPVGATAPPAVSPTPDLPPLPPDFQSLEASEPHINTSQPKVQSTDNTQASAPPNTPPIISVMPKKKFGGGRIIATILGILLLVGGIGAGILLTQQKQLIPQKAYTQTWSGENDTCNLTKISAVENSGYCNPLGSVSDGFRGTNDFGDTYSTTYTITNLTAQAHEVAYTKLTYYCPTFAYGHEDGQYAGSCVLNPVSESGTVTIQANQSADFLAERNGLLRDGKSCGTYQTDFWITSIDGDPNCHHGGTGGPAAFGVCRTGRICQAIYSPPPTPTVTPSASPTGTPTSSPTGTATPTTHPTATPTGTSTPTTTSTPAPTSTPGPTGTPAPSLPQSGTGWPTIIGAFFGAAVILGSLLLAL